MIRDGLDFVYTPQVIFRADARWLYGREPVLRRMPDGSLFCTVYSGGPREPHNDNVVLGTRSDDDGMTWSAPEVLFHHRARAAWATELFTGGEHPCLFVHTFDAASHYTELKTFRTFSKDSGRTWSEPTTLPGGFSTVSMRQGIILHDGAWLFPVYWHDVLGHWNWLQGGTDTDANFWRFRCGAVRSNDQGVTFTIHGNLMAECHLWEPNVVEIAPNHLVMLMRAEGVPVKYRAESHDGGVTWTAPAPTTIPDANSKITLFMRNGKLLMLHNPSSQPGWLQRTSLELWSSDDGGATWPNKRVLVKACEPDRVICYPHGFIDEARGSLYVACDTSREHYFFRVPLGDL
ncbi:MAG TPA: sialidase family protein [Armatimonadota bacterium]|jgi:predicted neuraminidase